MPWQPSRRRLLSRTLSSHWSRLSERPVASTCDAASASLHSAWIGTLCFLSSLGYAALGEGGLWKGAGCSVKTVLSCVVLLGVSAMEVR